MKLNYYFKDDLLWAEVFTPCPGCGEYQGLAMHVKLISPSRRTYKFYIQCRCGWIGPEGNSAKQGTLLWEARKIELKELCNG